MLPQEQPSRVAETTAEEAFSLAESLGDSGRAARAAALAFEALLRTGDPGLDSRPDRMETWAERARLNAVPGTRANVFYNIVLALLSIRAGQPSDVGPFLRKALDEAEAVGDNSTYYVAAGWAFSNMSSLRDLERRAQLAREIISRPRDGARSADVAGCLLTGGLELLRIGQRDEAEGLWKELELIAQQTNDATSKTQAIVPPVLLAFMNGLLEDAVAQSVAVETAREQVSTRTLPFRQPMTALFYLGRIEEVDEESLSFGPTRTTRAALALYYAYSGRFAEAKDITKTFEGISSAEDDTSAGILGALFQAALLGGDLETIGPLAARMGQTPVRAQPTLGQGFVSMARLLGEAAALLEKPEEARTRFDEALIDCERIGLRPDRALTRLDLAELLLDHYPDERDKAIEQLDFAIAEFRDMKMQPALERALGRRGLLKA
jgi:tetratricopeptide (TPR) repeat protein